MDLLDSRATTLKLEELGRWYTGTAIAEIEETHRREYVKDGIGDLLYWHDKKPTPGITHDPRTGQPLEPVKQYEITVDVGEPDAYGSTERTLYMAKKREIAAFRQAWRKSGAPRGSSVVGCKIAARWSGTEPGAGTVDANLYEYRIQAPADGWKPRAEKAPTPEELQRAGQQATHRMQENLAAPYGPPTDRDRAAVHAGGTPPSNVTAAGPSHPGPTTRGGLPCPAVVPPATWTQMDPAQQLQMYQALGLTTDQPAGPPPATEPPLASMSSRDDEPPF